MQLNKTLELILPLILNLTQAHDDLHDGSHSSIIPSSNATFHTVSLGDSGTGFQPNSLNAQPGDKVKFHFYPGTRGIAQSSYSKPCEPIAGGISSGNLAVATSSPASTFEIRVNDNSTIWLYSSVGKECAEGVAMVINPQHGDTLETYKSNAKNVTPSSPTAVSGDILHLPNATNATPPHPSDRSAQQYLTTTLIASGTALHKPTTTATLTHTGAPAATTSSSGAGKDGGVWCMMLFGLGVALVGLF